jgi:hypothetical protein
VHCGVALHESPPAQQSVSAGLEGEVGEVIGGKPKTLLCRVWPQHADDDVVREASDEGLASRCPHENIGAKWPAEGTPGDRLHQLGVDKAEGAEAQVAPGVSVTPRPSIRSTEFIETHDVPLPGAPNVGLRYCRQ